MGGQVNLARTGSTSNWFVGRATAVFVAFMMFGPSAMALAPDVPALPPLSAAVAAGSGLDAAAGAAALDPGRGTPAAVPLAGGGLRFVENAGQWHDDVLFRVEAGGAASFLTRSGVVTVIGSGAPPARVRGESVASVPPPSFVTRFGFPDASGPVAVEAIGERREVQNFLLGNDPDAWVTGARVFERVLYRDVHPGVDVVFRGSTDGLLEYDFIVAPGADPALARVAFATDAAPVVTDFGALEVASPLGVVTHRAPIAFQDGPQGREPVVSAYAVHADGSVGFELGSFDATRPLIIDPVVDFSTYLGGSDFDQAHGAGTDAVGNVYIIGWTASTDYPTVAPYQGVGDGYGDVFVTKINSVGDTILYSTFIGGFDWSEFVYDGTVGADGTAFIIGETPSIDFPLVNAFDTDATRGDAFITALAPGGQSLTYSSFFGGLDYDEGQGVEVDADGNAYIVGIAGDANFPMLNPFRSYSGGEDGFIAKIAPDGTLLWSSYLGGTSSEYMTGVTISGDGSPVVVGYGYGGYPTTPGAYQETVASWTDFIVTKLHADGSGVAWATYLGGTRSDSEPVITTGADGTIFIAGSTGSADFPLLGSYDRYLSGGTDGVVARFAEDGRLMSSTLIGGSGYESIYGIGVDSKNTVYVTGSTGSYNYPRVDADYNFRRSYYDAFLSRFSPTLGQLLFSSYYGSTDDDEGLAIAIDHLDRVTFTGYSYASGFPLENHFGTFQGRHDAWARRHSELKVVEKPILQIGATTLGAAPGDVIDFDFIVHNPDVPLTGELTVTPHVTWPMPTDPSGSYALDSREDDWAFLQVQAPGDAETGDKGTFDITFEIGGRSMTVPVTVVVTHDALVITSGADVDTNAGAVRVSALVQDATNGGILDAVDVDVTFTVFDGSTEVASVACAGASAAPCVDAASGEFRATIGASALPERKRLTLRVTAVDTDGSVARAHSGFVVPGGAPVVFGQVTDTDGGTVGAATVYLSHDRGEYYVHAAGAPPDTLATATTDGLGWFTFDLTGVDLCSSCRLRVKTTSGLVVDSLPFPLDAFTDSVQRDVVVGDTVAAVWSGPVDAARRALDDALDPMTGDLLLRLRQQKLLEENVAHRDKVYRAVDTFVTLFEIGADAKGLVSGLRGVRHQEQVLARTQELLSDKTMPPNLRKLFLDRGLETVTHRLRAERVGASIDFANLVNQAFYDNGVASLSPAEREYFALGAQARYSDPILDEIESILASPEGSEGFLLRGEQPLDISDLYDIQQAGMDTVLTDPWAQWDADQTLPQHRRDTMLRSLGRLQSASTDFVSGDMDRGRFLSDLRIITQGMPSYAESPYPHGYIVHPLPWLEGHPTDGHVVYFSFRMHADWYDDQYDDVDRLLEKERNAKTAIWATRLWTAVSGAVITAVVCAPSVATGPGAVLCVAGVGAIVYGAGEALDQAAEKVAEMRNYPLIDARLTTYGLAQDWRDENLRAPVLLKSAVDTALQESVTPDHYHVDRNDGASPSSDGLDAGPTRLAVTLPVDTDLTVASTPDGLVAERMLAELTLVNPSTRPLPNGSHEAVPVTGTVVATTRYGDFEGVVGAGCGNAPFAPAAPVLSHFTLEADATATREQTVTVPFDAFAALRNPCRVAHPERYQNENVVTLEVKVGHDRYETTFTLDPRVVVCPEAPCAAPAVAASGATERALTLLDVDLSTAAPSATTTFVTDPDARVARFRVDAPFDARAALTVTDADGRRAGFLPDLLTDGAAFPATVLRERPDTMTVTVPEPAGRTFTVTAHLEGVAAAAAPVQVTVEQPAKRLGHLEVVAPTELIYRPGENLTVEIGVLETGGMEALGGVDVTAYIDDPDAANIQLASPDYMWLDRVPAHGRSAARFLFTEELADERTGPGRYDLSFRITGSPASLPDQREWVTVTLIVDETPPVVTVTAAPTFTDNAGTVLVAPGAEIAVSATDDTSVTLTQYRVDDGPWTPYLGPFTLSGLEGARRIEARAFDVAGLEGGDALALTVDATAPTLRLLTPPQDSAATAEAVVRGDADGDGADDVTEEEAGTDPRDAADRPGVRDVAVNGGFASDFAGWEVATTADLRIDAADDTPFPRPATRTHTLRDDLNDAYPYAADQYDYVQSVHDLYVPTGNAFHPQAAGPAPRDDAVGVLVMENATGILRLTQTFPSDTGRFEGVSFDAYARDAGGAVTVDAVVVAQDGATRTLTATTALPAGTWDRVVLPRSAFPTVTSDALIAPWDDVDVTRVTFTFHAPQAPTAVGGLATYARHGDPVKLDDFRVFVGDEAAAHEAATALVAATSTWLDDVAAVTPGAEAWLEARAALAPVAAEIAAVIAAADATHAQAEREVAALIVAALQAGVDEALRGVEPLAVDVAGEAATAAGTPHPMPAGVRAALAAAVAVGEREAAPVTSNVPAVPDYPPSEPDGTRVSGVVTFRGAFDPTVNGVASGLGALTFTLDGAPLAATATGDGGFAVDFTAVAPGTYTLVVTATDESGNASTLMRDVVVTAQ